MTDETNEAKTKTEAVWTAQQQRHPRDSGCPNFAEREAKKKEQAQAQQLQL